MNRRFAVRSLLIAGAGSLLPPFASGTEPDFTIHSDVRLVLLDVSVKDHSGLPVAGLVKSNFAVFEDGHECTISVFAKDDTPVTVGLLVDESESMRSRRADVLVAALTFIQESNPKDEVFVLNFNDTVRRGLPSRTMYSDDVRELRQALNRGTPQGRTALNDAVVEGLDMLRPGTRGRKALLVISDGGDNASRHRSDEVTNLIETRLATIYAVGLYDISERETNPGFLRRLAKTSGGQVYFPQRPGDTVQVCRAIARDIRSRYTVGYVPHPGQSLRHLFVKVSAPNHGSLVARTRTTYRYDTHAT
jgi:Ca-activated chloride channel family protein